MGTLGLKRNAKIALSLIYFALVLLVRGALRLAGRLPSQRLTILYYHGVPATRRRGFVRQMDALKRAACVLPAAYRGELPSKRKCVALTFDDGLHSVIENALPELAARSFHSTIFVPVGLIGRRPDWRMEEGASELAEVVMTVEQLRALDGERVAIGSHTISHPSMSGLDRHGARKEIEDSRHQLAAASGREVRLFSFP
jgi:peptidoglycan/xylan/chitin deacetylase (PgdA/CDA1 family)